MNLKGDYLFKSKGELNSSQRSMESNKEESKQTGNDPQGTKRTRKNHPKETVKILLDWLKNNLKNPYPNYHEKTELCK